MDHELLIRALRSNLRKNGDLSTAVEQVHKKPVESVLKNNKFATNNQELELFTNQVMNNLKSRIINGIISYVRYRIGRWIYLNQLSSGTSIQYCIVGTNVRFPNVKLGEGYQSYSLNNIYDIAYFMYIDKYYIQNIGCNKHIMTDEE